MANNDFAKQINEMSELLRKVQQEKARREQSGQIPNYPLNPFGSDFLTLPSDRDPYSMVMEAKEAKKKKATPTPSEIVAKLSEKVIGQEKAKKSLAIAAYFHYNRLYNSKATFRKSNICMVGPTGTGKTYILENLAKILNVPFVTVDATEMTPVGYYGANPGDFVDKLLQLSDKGNPEHGIVFIDEADKLASGSGAGGSNIKSTGTQQGLLKLVEGTNHDGFDTSKVLFVIGGAFASITSKKNYAGEISPQDLVNFGLIPEFVGRFPIITTLEPLKAENLKTILTEPVDNVIGEFTQIFSEHGVLLKFEDDALNTIAEAALAMNTGARALRSVVEAALFEHLYTLPDSEKGAEVVITRDALLEMR